MSEFRDADRGAADPDLAALDKAAHQIAVAENRAVFHGWEEASIGGIAQVSPLERMKLGEAPDSYPRPVAGAVRTTAASRDQRSVCARAGRRAIPSALSRPRSTAATHCSNTFTRSWKARSPGPPGSRGQSCCSQRGGDFLFESGQDLSIGYDSHNSEVIRLYLEESFSFHVATPEAAVALEA